MALSAHTNERQEESLETSSSARPGFSRNVSPGFLIGLSALDVYPYRLMTQPFLSALTWAASIAVVAHPLHSLLERRVRQRDLAALLAVILVTALLIVPGIFLISGAIRESADGLREVQSFLGSDRWRSFLEQRHMGRAVSWLESNLDLDSSPQSLAAAHFPRDTRGAGA